MEHLASIGDLAAALGGFMQTPCKACSCTLIPAVQQMATVVCVAISPLKLSLSLLQKYIIKSKRQWQLAQLAEAVGLCG